MVKHAFVGYQAFYTFKIKLRVPLEQFCAMRATAKVHFALTDLQRHGPCQWLFRQTGWAYNQVIRLPKVFLRIGDEEISASLATESVFFTVMALRNGILFADA